MSKNEKLVTVEVDICDDIFLIIAKQAHKKDITFNQMCVEILKQKIARNEKKINKDKSTKPV